MNSTLSLQICLQLQAEQSGCVGLLMQLLDFEKENVDERLDRQNLYVVGEQHESGEG